jgi:hypothetical protein
MLARLCDHGQMYSTSVTKKAELNAYFKGNPPESPERIVAQHESIRDEATNAAHE